MNKKEYFLILWLIFGLPLFINGQVLRGNIVEAISKIPLAGATVYQDGTTNVTVTDENGYFELNTKNLNNTIIVRYIGYQTEQIDSPLKFNTKLLQIALKEELLSLEEVVVVRRQLFTRREMLRAFRREFLGTSVSALRCKIVNEDDLVLSYNSFEKTFTASAKKPLKIINKYLDYEVSFDLHELKVLFSSSNTLEAQFVATSYFSGSTFYIDTSKNKNSDKKRRSTFYGSSAHLMYALAFDKMEQEQWELIVGTRIKPSTYFEITDTLQLKKIRLIKKPVKIVKLNSATLKEAIPTDFTRQKSGDSSQVIRKPAYFIPYYKSKEQSIMEFKESVIYVDFNGNFTPIYGITFGGYIGSLRAGDLLPTDYYQSSKDFSKTLQK